MSLHGLGVPRDVAQAASYFERAAHGRSMDAAVATRTLLLATTTTAQARFAVVVGATTRGTKQLRMLVQHLRDATMGAYNVVLPGCLSGLALEISTSNQILRFLDPLSPILIVPLISWPLRVSIVSPRHFKDPLRREHCRGQS